MLSVVCAEAVSLARRCSCLGANSAYSAAALGQLFKSSHISWNMWNSFIPEDSFFATSNPKISLWVSASAPRQFIYSILGSCDHS